MSAFAGFVSFGTAGVPPGTCERLCASLDGAGLAMPRVHRTDDGVFVFRQRVLSPEDRWECQPSTTEGVVSMFDGRLDNREELLDALGLRSPAHAPIPDGHLVRAAYERWEEEAAPRLLGDFAWAVWNVRGRRLMLARDHGIHRALFFSRGDGFIAFATGYRPLLALPDVPRELDETAAADLLMTCPDESERSFYKGISWVVPAGRVVARAGGVRQDRFWDPSPRPTLRLRRDEDYLDAARAVFDAAVACRLRVEGPIVCSVSGGLDSSAVAATAARRLAPSGVRGLTVVPTPGDTLHSPGTQYADERPLVQALKRLHPNLCVEYLESATPEEFELDARPLFAQAGVPFRSPSNAGWFWRLDRRAAELGATTVLGGDIGNITFSATGLDRLTRLRREGAWGAFLNEMVALRRSQPHAWRGLLRHHLMATLPGGVAARLRQWRQGTIPFWQRHCVLNPGFIRDAGLEEHIARNAILLWDANGLGGRIAGMRYILLRSRMQVEGYAALRSLVGTTRSDPFGDRRVLDFCLSLPDEQFLRGGQTRALARRAFADRLPAEILHNTRSGAQDTDWHRRIHPHRDRLAAELERLERSALAGRILDLPRMRGMLDTWLSAPQQARSEARRHRHMLMRALHLGQYLHWIEGGNR